MAGQQAGAPEPALDLVLAQIQGARAAAQQQISALDTKAGFILGSSSFLVVAISGLQTWGTGHHGARHVLLTLRFLLAGQRRALVLTTWSAVEVLALAALLVYLATIYAAWQAYRATTAYVTPAPPRLATYVTSPDAVVKRALIRALVESYVTLDAPMLAHKFRWTRRALWALLTEAVVSAILVVVAGWLATLT